MKDFLKHFYLTLMNKYGSFMWFGAHMGVTQVDWHWILETSMCVLINLMVLHTIYIEWKDSKVKN
jgi:C4-dicarboxylate transporter